MKDKNISELQRAVTLYKKARDNTYKCPDLIKSSRVTDEAKKLMQAYDDAREYMYLVAGIKK